ncbi:Isochorismatase hydrolase [Dacryopinax primogenitus]|uniref:Isochorismatase hydrolase n=1 Tax=Dacryopinax primogenitus (strain DJM 731) TaxID=1858805 RepID=M5FN36_DACPD|nr:Isochorismatase hydrolase [Dacryopinax primogenitus]EJT96760.1 Isochorismatase hydrolase [Dacryopinax primogenitus]
MGDANTPEELKFGSAYNYWIKTDAGFDLSRGSPEKITVKTTKDPIMIAPKKTALIIIDMQNYFLHEKLFDNGPGRESVPLMMETVCSCRKAGIPVVWCNMGMNEADRYTLPPSYLAMSYKRDNATFNQSIGTVSIPGQAKPIDMGGKLIKGSWNAELWGPLKAFAEEGYKLGTDVHIWKNRFSALCGHQPLELWLQENQITTTLWGGVVTDVCVWGSMLDAYYKGYDMVMVKELANTTSPDFVVKTAYRNTENWGWLTSTSSLMEGIEQASA